MRTWKEVEDEHLMRNPDMWGSQDVDEGILESIEDMGGLEDDDDEVQ